MAFDEELAHRLRELLADDPGMSERRMFGGLAFMIDGHMACGVVGGELMVRLGSDGADAALERDHVRPMDFTGRPITTMVYVAAEGLHGDGLRDWARAGVDFVRTLPPKR